MSADLDGPGLGDAGVRPSPGLSVTDVVLAQLDGLRREQRAGAGAGPGLQQVWAFASPGNRAATGPLDRFADMLRGPVYGGLLEHRAAQLGPVLELGDEAQQEVLVITSDDRALGFTWVLGRQEDPPHAGCWLTEGVLCHPEQP